MTAPAPSKLLLTLYRGFLDHGKHVVSPFVVKMEARLRFAGVAYATAAGSPLKAPKGKIPYLEVREGDSTSTLCDSALMIKALTERGILPDLNASLGPEQRSHDLALRAMLEEKLYFMNGWEKWSQNYYVQRDHVMWSIPWPIRVLVGLLAYRKHMATMHGQGTARFTPEEIFAFRAEIWASVADLLQVSKAKQTRGKDVFWVLGGDEPTEADATLFGFITSVMVCPSNPQAQKDVQRHPIVVEYGTRIHDKYFPDYEKWSSA